MLTWGREAAGAQLRPLANPKFPSQSVTRTVTQLVMARAGEPQGKLGGRCGHCGRGLALQPDRGTSPIHANAATTVIVVAALVSPDSAHHAGLHPGLLPFGFVCVEGFGELPVPRERLAV